MNKIYGVAAVIACAIVVGVLAFTHSNQTNSPVQSQQPAVTISGPNQQPNITNSVSAKPASTSGKHFFANVNETVTVKSNP